MSARLTVEIPRRMRTLPRDPRGYPVPYVVLLDKRGAPQFTINDVRRSMKCEREGLCSICGKRFERDLMGRRLLWFVGGSRCFLHPDGAFLDGPNHLECAEYALRVCPFLAARRYSGRIDDAKLDPTYAPDGLTMVRHEYAEPSLPESFGLGLAEIITVRRHATGNIYTVPRWRYVEFWHAGQPVNSPDRPEGPPLPDAANSAPPAHARASTPDRPS